MTDRQIERWNEAFYAALDMSPDCMTSDDRLLAVRLRESGRNFAYAAARVRMRITRRARLALAGW